jgi:micrococcal nuclease
VPLTRALAFAAACALTGCTGSVAVPEFPGADPPPGLPVTITRVVDGDTVEATDRHGARVKVRILGIDSPETRHPGRPVECWGPEATAHAEAHLLDQAATLVADPIQDARDRYGRVLAYVVLADGRDYSVLAARDGAARAYTYDRPVVGHAAIAAAEADARAAGRGLWGAC